jgi:hypothetical protein
MEGFMSKKNIGIILLVVGILIIVGSLGAGYLGLSASQTLGTKKILGAVVGVVVDVVGIYLMVSKPKITP